jgi:2,3-bisphosphoglycerate-independent phosphoglycerate mutase
MQRILNGLIQKNKTKILLGVLDGLGGLPMKGKTELEAARKPNLDALARKAACGLHMPVAQGITPGSGPGHLSLFGYDPLEWQIGRGVLEALGLGVALTKNDIAVRVNYATLEGDIITDRRAGRIPTEKSRKITKRLQKKIKKIEDAQILFAPGMEHRFAVILRFPEPLPEGSDAIKDTDPQKEGRLPIPVTAEADHAEHVARIAEKLIVAITEEIKKEPKANFVLFRGFSQIPDIPRFEAVFGLRPLCIAVYPMYRGLARLIGMDAPDLKGDLKDEVRYLTQHYDEYDFFFLHFKKVDSYGEDGNFEGKASKIEEFDRELPNILGLNPDVLILTGDHSTPSVLKSHSWHPVPIMLHSKYVLGKTCKSFTERECIRGELGIFPTVNLMPLALANALRLKKFGA